jgi:Lar family restriction alleviation protein
MDDRHEAVELKPDVCPFCGEADIAFLCTGAAGELRFGAMSCHEGCSARGPVSTEAEALAAWNRRAPDPSLSAAQAEIERLRGELQRQAAQTLKATAAKHEAVKATQASQARVAALEAGRDEIAKMLRSELVGRTHGAYDRGVRAGLNSALAALSPEASHD